MNKFLQDLQEKPIKFLLQQLFGESLNSHLKTFSLFNTQLSLENLSLNPSLFEDVSKELKIVSAEIQSVDLKLNFSSPSTVVIKNTTIFCILLTFFNKLVSKSNNESSQILQNSKQSKPTKQHQEDQEDLSKFLSARIDAIISALHVTAENTLIRFIHSEKEYLDLTIAKCEYSGGRMKVFGVDLVFHDDEAGDEFLLAAGGGGEDGCFMDLAFDLGDLECGFEISFNTIIAILTPKSLKKISQIVETFKNNSLSKSKNTSKKSSNPFPLDIQIEAFSLLLCYEDPKHWHVFNNIIRQDFFQMLESGVGGLGWDVGINTRMNQAGGEPAMIDEILAQKLNISHTKCTFKSIKINPASSIQIPLFSIDEFTTTPPKQYIPIIILSPPSLQPPIYETLKTRRKASHARVIFDRFPTPVEYAITITSLDSKWLIQVRAEINVFLDVGWSRRVSGLFNRNKTEQTSDDGLDDCPENIFNVDLETGVLRLLIFSLFPVVDESIGDYTYNTEIIVVDVSSSKHRYIIGSGCLTGSIDVGRVGVGIGIPRGGNGRYFSSKIDFNVVPIAIIYSPIDGVSNTAMTVSITLSPGADMEQTMYGIAAPNPIRQTKKGSMKGWLDVDEREVGKEFFESVDFDEEVEITMNVDQKKESVVVGESEEEVDLFGGYFGVNFSWVEAIISCSPKFIKINAKTLLISATKQSIDTFQHLILSINLALPLPTHQQPPQQTDITSEEIAQILQHTGIEAIDLMDIGDDTASLDDIPFVESTGFASSDSESDGECDVFQSASGGSVFGMRSMMMESTKFSKMEVKKREIEVEVEIDEDFKLFSCSFVCVDNVEFLMFGESVVDGQRLIDNLVYDCTGVDLKLFSTNETIENQYSKSSLHLDLKTSSLSTPPIIHYHPSTTTTSPNFSLSLSSKFDFQENKKTQSIDVHFHNLTISTSLQNNISSTSSWWRDISAFLTPTPLCILEEAESSTRVAVFGIQCTFLGDVCDGIGSLILFENFKVSFDIGLDAIESNTCFTIGHAKIGLSEIVIGDGIFGQEDIHLKKGQSYIQALTDNGVAFVASIDDFELVYSHNIDLDKRVVELTNNKMFVDTCADSFQSLVGFFKHYFPEKDESGDGDEVEGRKRSVSFEPMKCDLIDIFAEMDENAFNIPQTIEKTLGFFEDDLPESIDGSGSEESNSPIIMEDDFFAVPKRKSSEKELNRFEKDFDFPPDQDEIITILDPDFCLKMDYIGADNTASKKPVVENNVDMFIKVYDFNITWRIFDGFDWESTRKEIRRRSLRRTSMHSVSSDTSRSSIPKVYLNPRATLTRSKSPKVEFRNSMIKLNYKKFRSDPTTITTSSIAFSIRDFDITDNVESSSWRKFLSYLTPSKSGNRAAAPRENGSNMVDVKLEVVRPNLNSLSEESRLEVKVLPLCLRIDQDTLTCLMNFFSYKADNEDGEDIEIVRSPTKKNVEPFFQHVKVSNTLLQIDYKPRHVDISNLTNGNFLEFMNFAMLTGAQMTLDSIQLSGIAGWDKVAKGLVNTWLPHLKLQVPQVISTVSGVDSLVNIGGGIADLILLPLEQFQKDGRIVRGLQRGVQSFTKATTMETLKLSTKLAAGTQVFLEQADEILSSSSNSKSLNFGEEQEVRSKFSVQPKNIQEGVGMGYVSLKRNLSAAANVVLAIPTDVYERSSKGTVQAVIRAVPIAVLKPMIGTAEALTKTLIGARNSIDPDNKEEMEEKYK